VLGLLSLYSHSAVRHSSSPFVKPVVSACPASRHFSIPTTRLNAPPLLFRSFAVFQYGDTPTCKCNKPGSPKMLLKTVSYVVCVCVCVCVCVYVSVSMIANQDKAIHASAVIGGILLGDNYELVAHTLLSAMSLLRVSVVCANRHKHRISLYEIHLLKEMKKITTDHRYKTAPVN